MNSDSESSDISSETATKMWDPVLCVKALVVTSLNSEKKRKKIKHEYYEIYYYLLIH